MNLLNNKMEHLYSNLFFLFFTAQILSPYISGKTIYLEVIIAIFNPYFWKWIYDKNNIHKIDKNYILVILGLILIAILGHISTAVKILVIFLCVIHLFYLYDKNLWKLNRYLIISILLGIMQFIFTFIDPIMAALIGPTSISTFIWGDSATPTYTNFFTVFYFPRVSGLSREAGFFASYIIVAIFLSYIERKKYPKKIYLMYFLGYIISFSKMSLAILGVFFINSLKKFINYIPIGFGVILFIGSVSIIVGLNKDFILNDPTFLHRFSGYISLYNLDMQDVLFGIDFEKVGDYSSKSIMAENLQGFAGFAGWIIENGIIVICIFFIILYLLNINMTGIYILLLFTINVSPDSNQNFVVLTYFIILKYYCKNNISWYKFLK